MVYLIALYSALSLATISHGCPDDQPSYLKSDEARWAKRLGVKQSYIHEIVKTAGFAEDDQVRIEDLDLRHLSVRKHILLVTTAGNGHCLTLSVVGRKKESMEQVWKADELGGAGFCHDGARTGDFQARATEAGVIIVDVPKYANGKYVMPVKQLVYKWNGHEYVLDEQLRRRVFSLETHPEPKLPSVATLGNQQVN